LKSHDWWNDEEKELQERLRREVLGHETGAEAATSGTGNLITDVYKDVPLASECNSEKLKAHIADTLMPTRKSARSGYYWKARRHPKKERLEMAK